MATTAGHASHLLNGLIRTLLGPVCAACDGPLDSPVSQSVCSSCLAAWPHLRPPLCARCGDELDRWRSATDPHCPRCRRGAGVITAFRSAGAYDGSLRDMIHAFKYRKRRMIAGLLGDRMRAAAVDLLCRADAVVPVPLHPFRQWDRGFNQADDLARMLQLPVWRALRRVRAGPPQASLPAAKRHGNTRHAFALSLRERLRAIRGRSRLRGAILVLVDDVVTTGATSEECARVLLRAGASEVTTVSAARAVGGRLLRPPPEPHLSAVRHR